MKEPVDSPVPFKLGDPVKIVGEEAQAAVGTDSGVVVGDTAGQVDTDEVKVVIAPDGLVLTNAVISPADVEAD